jgi:hypothetical protein
MSIEKLPGVGDLSEDELGPLSICPKNIDFQLRRRGGVLWLNALNGHQAGWTWRLNRFGVWTLQSFTDPPNLFDVLDELRAKRA